MATVSKKEVSLVSKEDIIVLLQSLKNLGKLADVLQKIDDEDLANLLDLCTGAKEVPAPKAKTTAAAPAPKAKAKKPPVVEETEEEDEADAEDEDAEDTDAEDEDTEAEDEDEADAEDEDEAPAPKKKPQSAAAALKKPAPVAFKVGDTVEVYDDETKKFDFPSKIEKIENSYFSLKPLDADPKEKATRIKIANPAKELRLHKAKK